MAMTALTPLDRTAATFRTDVDGFFTTDLPLFVTEANVLESAVDGNKLAAAASETAASLSETNAANSVALAAAQVALAEAQVTLATAQADAAATSAASAVSSPATNATSTTSLSISSGIKSLTIQTGKSIVLGQFMLIANAADVGLYMIGQVTAYNSGTGALSVNVTEINGSGTLASWTVSLTSAPAPAVTSTDIYNINNGII